MSEAQARAYYWLNKNHWKDTRPKTKPRSVCFTGFTALEQEALMQLASQKGLTVSKSVTKSLDYLVTGPNVGPVKLTKAKSQGVRVITSEDFMKRNSF